MRDEMSEVRDRIANLEVDVREIQRESESFATSSELEEMESYMDVMNPIKNSFVTREEAEKLAEEKARKAVRQTIKNRDSQTSSGDQ
ncbi:hypothetical protein GLU01_01235 [Nanohaloarchaea archaeon]|nr:hypothetical protein [Candidatus Nanohaloarchaea archaeon]